MDIFPHRGKNIEKERKSKQKLLMTAFAVDFFSVIKLVLLLFVVYCGLFQLFRGSLKPDVRPD